MTDEELIKDFEEEAMSEGVWIEQGRPPYNDSRPICTEEFATSKANLLARMRQLRTVADASVRVQEATMDIAAMGKSAREGCPPSRTLRASVPLDLSAGGRDQPLPPDPQAELTKAQEALAAATIAFMKEEHERG